MTAFLFIPSTGASHPSRRVDLHHFAGLFAEEEPAPVRQKRGADAVRFVGALLFVLVAMGDMVVLARPLSAISPATASEAHKPAVT